MCVCVQFTCTYSAIMAADSTFFEYIVVGCGGVGSGAMYWLSKRAGKNVLGIEQFDLGHHNGGSQDHSRIIRLIYNDERYTKLTPDTYTAWAEIEKQSGIQLVWKTGSVHFTRKGSAREGVLDEYAQAMSKQNIPYERLTAADLRSKIPTFQVADDIVALYQKDGGLVDAAMGNAVHIQLARAHGATILDNCPVLKLQPTPNGGCIVHTTKGLFSCRRVIVTAGAWLNHVLGSVGVHIPVTVTQEQVTYFATPHIKKFTKEKFPVFLYHGDELDIYGLPIHGNCGVKLGIDAGGPAVLPNTRTFTPDPHRETFCKNFFQKHIPEAVGPVLYTKTCLYTMTHDRHFVVDTLKDKGYQQIIVCCGAGHVYKFASLMGKILAEMAIEGSTQYDISGFSMNREAIENLDSKPSFNITYNPSKKSNL